MNLYGIDYDNIGIGRNLISSNIFDMFPSTTHITIDHGVRSDNKYIFDLFMFLEIICKADTWKIIKIKETFAEKKKNTSWLYGYYNHCSSSLQTQYQKHGLTIKFDSETLTENNKITLQEYLTISRI